MCWSFAGWHVRKFQAWSYFKTNSIRGGNLELFEALVLPCGSYVHVTLMYAAGFEQHDSREIWMGRQTGPQGPFPCWEFWGGPPLGVQILYTFPTPKMGIESNKSNCSVTSSCASCGFLRSRLESQSWNSFNPFPIVNRVATGVPTPPDSGKTPQLKTSKLAQNCGKTEILHLQPSYGICWSHEIETLPPM